MKLNLEVQYDFFTAATNMYSSLALISFAFFALTQAFRIGPF
jgi:hypothetical protein